MGNLTVSSYRSRFLKYKGVQSRYAQEMAAIGQKAGDDVRGVRQNAPSDLDSSDDALDSWYDQIAGEGKEPSKTQSNGRMLAKWTFFALLFALFMNVLSVAWYFGCTRRRRSQSAPLIDSEHETEEES